MRDGSWIADEVAALAEQIRSDGLHFTEAGVQDYIAPWLVPQLATLAVYGPRNTGRSD